MKKKIKDISNSEMNKLCKQYNNCNICPLKREIDKRQMLFCHKTFRAWLLSDRIYYENTFTGTEEQREIRLEEIKEMLEKLGEEEIEL